MMNIKFCTLYFLLSNLLHYSSAECSYQEGYVAWKCSTLEDVVEKSSRAWQRLGVSSCLHLKMETFQNAPNLLQLLCLNVESIEDGTFSGLKKLDELGLQNVTLEQIPLGIFDDLSIRKLYMYQSNLKHIQPGLFKKLPMIEYMQLYNNTIVDIKKGVFDNSNIQILYMNSNKIIKIADKAFENMDQLKELSLTDNLLDAFSSEVFLGINKALKRLSLANNKLTKITTNTFITIPNLKDLFLQNNRIETIDVDSFKCLHQIENVDLSNNSIQEIPRGIFDNTSIRILYLASNRIETVAEKAFGNMNDLSYLSLRGNLLKSFSSELWFESSNSLFALWLSNNSLTEIIKDTFIATPNLVHLYIELNKIQTVEYGSFEHTPNLQILDISNNQIGSFEPRVFLQSGMKSLIHLMLHNNKLTYINIFLFDRTPNLQFITYAGNPFQCPCHTQLTKFLGTRNVTRICDQDYLEGERPVCVFSSVLPQQCLYAEELTDELYEVYTEAVKEYPKLELKCDGTKGLLNAVLNKFENI